MAKLCHIIFDDPERDSRVVAYADRYAADHCTSPSDAPARAGESHSLSIGCGSKGVMAIGLSHLCASDRLLGSQRLIGFQPCRAGRRIDSEDYSQRHGEGERDGCRRPGDDGIPVPYR